MKFDFNNILASRDIEFRTLRPFYLCIIFSDTVRLLLSVFVLSLVLTYIDTNLATSSAHYDEMIKSNAIVAISGLLSLRITFLVLSSRIIELFVSALLSEAIYDVGARVLPLIVSACVIYYLKHNYIEEYGIVFDYPIATIFSEVVIVLSLRSTFHSYGFRCGWN